MPASWKDGDEVDPVKAKERVKEMLADPAYKRGKGHPDDELTRDAPLPQYDETPEGDAE